ncbi:hypothetical protein GUJ93_ZPchr0012g21833 [Zizania palustris]|uniref:DUF7910 domain-containing protein n=1 Tax=Zizania palustris TaxID=103762 RepID=A0A8J5WMS4_ZIZPA|nr:hypothetical protein GUJ93_ZPchr0012g21833 [Zizania palustris]
MCNNFTVCAYKLAAIFEAANLTDDVPEPFGMPALDSAIASMREKAITDGTQITLRSVTNQMYLSAADGGGSTVAANAGEAKDWETFRLWKMENSDYMFKIRVIKDQFMGLNDNAELVAVTKSPAQSGIFQIIRNKDNIDQIKIKASSNGKLLQVMPDGSVKANGESGGSWSNSDPTIFTIHIDKNKQMDGDRQLCSFYGAEQAIKILQVFAWWITRDSGPPSCHPPNYPGYQAVLDRAFDWADKYNLRVIIDLHAAPGSQNGQAHGGSRDGTVRWGDAKINETVQVIKALADRYASRKAYWQLNFSMNHGHHKLD